MSSNEEVKIYVRNSKKYGKILNIPIKIKTEELYRLAAASHSLPSEEVKLILAGQPLPADESEVELKDKAIVHLINLKDVHLETIEVSVRKLYARSGPVTIETPTNVTIREFIDDKLNKAYGEKSDVLLLVHIGRQLNLDRTFQEELIENGSELTVANIQELKNRKNEPVREQ